MTSIYRWNGVYFGYLNKSSLFNAKSTYLGWVEADGGVWRKNGTYLGNITNVNYILRKTSLVTPPHVSSRETPVPHTLQLRRAYRACNAPMPGYVDALVEFEREYPGQ